MQRRKTRHNKYQPPKNCDDEFVRITGQDTNDPYHYDRIPAKAFVEQPIKNYTDLVSYIKGAEQRRQQRTNWLMSMSQEEIRAHVNERGAEIVLRDILTTGIDEAYVNSTVYLKDLKQNDIIVHYDCNDSYFAGVCVKNCVKGKPMPEMPIKRGILKLLKDCKI